MSLHSSPGAVTIDDFSVKGSQFFLRVWSLVNEWLHTHDMDNTYWTWWVTKKKNKKKTIREVGRGWEYV